MAPIPIPIITLPSTNNILDRLLRRSPSKHALALPSVLIQSLKRQSSNVSKRQSLNSGGTMIIPSGYGAINNSLAPGTIIAIVIGSVAGFLFILWLFYACATLGGGYGSRGSDYTESVVVRRKSHAGSHRSHRVSEVQEVRREAPPVRVVRTPSTHRVIVEESRETRRAVSRGGSDEVVVIEEHSPAPRRKPKRDKESGYRTVDPDAYGGVVGGRKDRRGSSGRR